MSMTRKVLPVIRKRLPVRTYIRSLLRWNMSPRNRFIVFAQGRTGSTLLKTLLNSHPGIHCEGEILQDPVLFGPLRYISARARLANAPTYGFKVKIYQLTEVQGVTDPKRWLRSASLTGWRIIHLKRGNVVRHAISTLIARQRRRKLEPDPYHNPLPDGQSPFEIDITELREAIADRERWAVQEKGCLEGLDYLELGYEDDLLRSENHQRTASRVFRFLGLSEAPVDTAMRRITKDELCELLSNYDEIASAVRVWGYGRYLAAGVAE